MKKIDFLSEKMNRGIKYFMSAGGVLFCVVAVSSYSVGYFRDFSYLDNISEDDCAFPPSIRNCKDILNKNEDFMDSVDLILAASDVIDSGGKSEKVFQQSLRAIEAKFASIEEDVNKWDRARGSGEIAIAPILLLRFVSVDPKDFLCKVVPVLRDHYQRGLIFRESDKLKRPDYPGVSIMTFLDESCPRQMEEEASFMVSPAPETPSDMDSSSGAWFVSVAVLFSMADILLYMMLLILSLRVMMRVSSVQALLSRILLISLSFCTISVAIDYASYFLLFPYFEETDKIGPFIPKLDIGLLLSSACVSSVIGLLFYLKNKVSSPLAI